MTKTLLSSFTGGAIGTNPTTTTEPWASSAGGIATNMTYEAGIAGTSGQSVQVTAARDLVWTTPGSRWRLGMWVNRVSGTQTAGLAFMLLRSGTTNRADVFLRNQNGGQIALRAGAGGTTYAGQSTTSIANGDAWWVELDYNATAVTVYLWKPGNTSGSADETFTGTAAGAVDNVRLFNPTGVTGMTMRFGELWMSDGEQIRAGSPAAGTLTFLSNVWADQSSAVIVGKVADATTVTVTVGGVSSSEVAPDPAGYFRAEVTGLAANTSHAWDVSVDGVSRRTGSVKTLPTSANGLGFGWGSCFDTNTSGVFDLMAARNPAFFAMLGDWGYQYITGGPNGNTSPTDVATVRAHREGVLSAAIPQAFFTGRPVSYTVSDCDGGGANSDATTGGLATGAVQSAYRQQFAHPTLPLSNSGARSWVVGRIRFIQTDETVAASAKAATDDASKTKLGAEQKAWFKAQIDAAKAAGQSVVWFGDGPWIETASVTGNSWRAYNTERAELGAYIAASGIRLVRLHGDTHTLFYDNGTNNPWGGFPTASAAPIHTTAQPFGFTVSGGKWPTASTNSSRQYGVASVADDGSALTLTLQGFSSTTGAPTEVERFNATVDMTPVEAVERSASGTLTLTGSATATVTVARTAPGTLALSGSASSAVTVTRTASGALALAGTGERSITVARSALGGLGIDGAATRGIHVSRAAEGTLGLAGVGAAGTDRTATGTLNLAGTGTATVTINRTATGVLNLAGTGPRTLALHRAAPGSITLTGGATRTVQLTRTATGTLTLTGAGIIQTDTPPFPDRLTITGRADRLTLTATAPRLTLEAT